MKNEIRIPEEEDSYPLKNGKNLDPLIQRIGDAHHVLLGEASHGTHEYYTWRTTISKRLIEEKGFRFIAVEGDWPDCYKLNRFVKGYDDQDKTTVDLLKAFNRWPTWMWANWEIVALIDWLKDFNSHLPASERVGFYGLDVYSLWESMEALMDYLSKHDARAAEYARSVIRCFEPFGKDEQRYARAQYAMDASCEQAVLQLLSEIRRKAPIYDHDPEAALNMEQNAAIAVNAENYYRSMIRPDSNTWNLRDTHMMETFDRILKFYGSAVKAIVWEHNTHIGDARFTDMAESGTINTGQLVRERKGANDTVLVGFGSYSGSVIAGANWGAPMQKMRVPDAQKGSIEDILHAISAQNKLLIFNGNNAKEYFKTFKPHRAIGVVYHPANERYGNYVPTLLNSRYDAFIYIDSTTALHPLHIRPDGHKIPETYPFEF